MSSAMMMFLSISIWVCLLLAVAGAAYALLGAVVVRRFFRGGGRPPLASQAGGAMPAVTVLRPLHGAEPGLADRLRALAGQRYGGPVQILCGVQNAQDPAVPVVRALQAELAAADSPVTLDLVIDPTRHGANAKIANLLNMQRLIRHEVLILADSDIGVPADYLDRVVGALMQPGVGLVTCLYRGAPSAELSPRRRVWADMAARTIDHHFLPNVLVGLRLGLARPCFGSTMALTAATLERVGGLAAFQDILADDHALGEAVRGLGLTVAVPAFVVDHLSDEAGFASLWNHELRWARTIRGLDPGGYLGSVVTYPLPIALIGAIFAGCHAWSLIVLGLAVGARIVLQVTVDGVIGRSRPLWRGPIRDILSFAVFVASFIVRQVSWRGQRFSVNSDGTMMSVGENGGL